MTRSLEVHDVSADFPLSSDQFREILAGDTGPIAFRGARDLDVAAEVPEGPPADITVIVANPGGSGRGPADLMARLWRGYPRTAAFLDDQVAGVGAVLLSESERNAAQEWASRSADPLGVAVMRAIGRGASIEAIIDQSVEDVMATHPPSLVPASVTDSQREMGELIETTPPEQLVSHLTSRVAGQAIIAGLLQWHDVLDESHTVSQSIQGEGQHVLGDYWHAIMHRREPDYGNAKYWFRRAGEQPIFWELADRADRYIARTTLKSVSSGGKWDSASFVDACQEVASSKDDVAADLALRCCQADEMLLLLEQSCRDASG